MIWAMLIDRWTKTASGGPLRLLRFGHSLPVRHADLPAAQINSSLRIDRDYLHRKHVTNLNVIFNAFHIAFGQFGNVHQAVRAWKDFAEDTKIHDLSNSSLINFAHFRLLRDRMDPLDREFGSLRIAGRNEHTAVILNVHVRATFLDDLSDIFSSWPNQITNFLWIDSQLSDSRSIVRKFL